MRLSLTAKKLLSASILSRIVHHFCVKITPTCITASTQRWFFSSSPWTKDGDVISSKPFWITIHVTANPEMRWGFPSEDEALAAIADDFNRAAKGRLEIARDFYEKINEHKKLKGKK